MIPEIYGFEGILIFPQILMMGGIYDYSLNVIDGSIIMMISALMFLVSGLSVVLWLGAEDKTKRILIKKYYLIGFGLYVLLGSIFIWTIHSMSHRSNGIELTLILFLLQIAILSCYRWFHSWNNRIGGWFRIQKDDKNISNK